MEKKKGKKKKKKVSTLQLLNFKNLQTEIYGYGYEYTFGKYASNLFFYLFAVFCFGKLYQLKTEYVLILCAIFFLLLPRVFLSEFKRLHEQKRFDDTVKYMRQLINCYDREPHKILPALRETQKIFKEEETMYTCIAKAIQVIETNVDDTKMYQNALKEIEKEYRCDEIRRLHSYLIRVEEEGGDFHQMLHILLDDTIRWQQRVYKYQKEKQWQRVLAVVMIFVCMLVGLAISVMFMQLRSIFLSSCPVSFHKHSFLVVTWLFLQKSSDLPIIHGLRWQQREIRNRLMKIGNSYLIWIGKRNGKMLCSKH